jgi:hypothetical protein
MTRPSSAGPPPPVIRAAHVSRPPAEAFAAFTEQIGAWWPVQTHGLFGADAGAVAFEDGRLVERAADGRTSVWAQVRSWEPPTLLVLDWHPGRTASQASRVEVRFIGDEDGTRVEVRHDGWAAFGQDALARRRAYVGPNAWGFVLDHFADVAEGRPDGPAPARLAALAAAYREFFAVADAGGFGPPPAGEWDAAQVIAHVALNDLAMCAVARRLIDGDAPTFANQTCQDRAALAAVIQGCGDLAHLIGAARAAAAAACAIAARLGPEQRGVEVPCRLTHDGQVALDAPLPWEQVAIELQTTRHLPAHLEQLLDLRPPA